MIEVALEIFSQSSAKIVSGSILMAGKKRKRKNSGWCHECG